MISVRVLTGTIRLAVAPLLVLTAACDEDDADALRDGSVQTFRDASLDARSVVGDPLGGFTSKWTYAQDAGRTLATYSITTPTGEVCTAKFDGSSSVVFASKRDDGNVCVVVENVLVVYESACVLEDAGAADLNARTQACYRGGWRLDPVP